MPAIASIADALVCCVGSSAARSTRRPLPETLDLTGANVLNLPTAALKNAPVLTGIILRRATGFTPALVDTLASLANLRQLDLRETTGLDDKQVRQLVKALPKCEILLPTERSWIR